MKKRALQASLLFGVMIACAALWARQDAPGNGGSPTEIEQHVEQFLREYYAWGPAFQIKVDPPTASPLPDLYQVSVAVTYQGQSDRAIVYVTHDGHYVIRGAIASLLANPYAENITKLDIANHPYVGPAKACVNVVEFSDFECPHCRDAHEGLEQLESKYPLVRFTSMDYPITEIHPWAMSAALAARCTYQEDPDGYPKLRTLLFQNQDKITPDNVFTTLAGYAAQLGLNAATFQACMASPETKKLVDADVSLGNELHVNSTPTFFVNGRPMAGWDGKVLEQFIGYEQAQCQAGH